MNRRWRGIVLIGFVVGLTLPAAWGQDETPPAKAPAPAAPAGPKPYEPVYGDIQFERKGEIGFVPPAVFPHWFHRMRFRCYVCHPSVFEMRKGAAEITMNGIREGKFCGTCHTGKLAWQITFDSCPKCHKGAAPEKKVAENK